MDRFYSSIKESNTPEHVLVINAVIRKLLRCSSVRHQALFVPWALSVQRDISERVEAGSKSSSIGAPHAWAPWAKLGHQLVARHAQVRLRQRLRRVDHHRGLGAGAAAQPGDA